jgi:hypothetical protein
MTANDELLQWLRQQSASQALHCDGATLNLRVATEGAELELELGAFNDMMHLHSVMQCGFASALEFDAGLGIMADGRTLVLSQWLPGVSNWAQAYAALEKLLNQLTDWRRAFDGTAAMSPISKPIINDAAVQAERRLRRMFTGAPL